MFVNCDANILVKEKEIETVSIFKYLGIKLSSKSAVPDILL
jgi:hypothetical protein